MALKKRIVVPFEQKNRLTFNKFPPHYFPKQYSYLIGRLLIFARHKSLSFVCRMAPNSQTITQQTIIEQNKACRTHARHEFLLNLFISLFTANAHQPTTKTVTDYKAIIKLSSFTKHSMTNKQSNATFSLGSISLSVLCST